MAGYVAAYWNNTLHAKVGYNVIYTLFFRHLLLNAQSEL